MYVDLVYRQIEIIDNKINPIVAISKNKDMIDKFMEHKNPKVYTRISHNMSDIEYTKLCIYHKDCIITDMNYITRDNDNIIKVTIQSTTNEFELMKDISMSLYVDIMDVINTPYDIFKNIIIKDLDILEYVDQYNSIYNKTKSDDILYIDELNIYLSMNRGDF